MPRFERTPKRSTAAVAAVALSASLGSAIVAAQGPAFGHPLISPADANWAREALEAWHEAAIGPLRERLPAELHFIARACPLTEDQRRELHQAGDEIVQREDARLALALKDAPFAGLPERGAEDIALAPSTDLIVPGNTLRNELDRAVRRLFPSQVAEALGSQRSRLEERLRQATLDALMAALDESMLLSASQRAEMREAVEVRGAGGGWLPPTTWERFVWPERGRRHSTMARCALALLHVSRIELMPILRSEQMTVANDARAYARHRELPSSDREARAGLSLESVAAACELTDEQLAKLRLAAKLDIADRVAEAFKFPRPSRGDRYADHDPDVVDGLLPAGIDAGDFPCYIKGVRHVLSPAQASALEAAKHERCQLHRQADLETVVLIFARRLLLTDDQCERLAQRLESELADVPACPHSRSEMMMRLARIPDEAWFEIVDEFQRPSAGLLLAELRKVAEKCAAERTARTDRRSRLK